MMKQLRENTKVILWIVVAAFMVTIFAVWGLDLQTTGLTGQSQASGLVGKVNGVPVTPQAYQAAYAQIAQQYRAAAPEGQLSSAQQDLLRQQAWESIVTNIITEQQVQELGITVTDQEVLSYLRNSPPPEIRQYFLDENGQFDYAAYQTALNNPDADWTAVEQLARQRIPLMKLNQYLVAQVHVGHDEIMRKYEEESLRMAVEYVEFPLDAEDASQYTPGEEDIDVYYAENMDNYRQPEKAAISFVKIPIEPTQTDREDIALDISYIRDQLNSGEEFEKLANTFSDGPTAAAGGDAGFVRADQRDPAIMMAARSLEAGAVSGPVWTEDGVYLIKLMETRETDGEAEYHLQEIQLEVKAGAATVDSLSTAAREFQAAAVQDGFDVAATAHGLTAKTTAPFIANFPIEGVGFSTLR